jgi:hypothetical protein
MCPITFEEVVKVVLEIPKGKSPGLDDFNTGFFQAYWWIIKIDVWDLDEECH